MAEFLATIVSADGQLPFLGDDDGGRFFFPYGERDRFARGTLAVASVLTGKRFFDYGKSDVSEIALWWLGPERCASGLVGIAASASRAFRDTGIVVMRRGPIVALFDAGPFGPGSAGHSHSDTLSLVVSVRDQEVLIDPGTFTYMDPEWRSYFRGSAAHNTVRLDGRDQAIAVGPFRWSDPPRAEFKVGVGRERECVISLCRSRDFAHTRTARFSEQEIIIQDRIRSASTGEHYVEQFWHFAIEPRELFPGKWSIGDIAEFTAEGGVVEPSWRSRCFGSKEPAWTVVVRRHSTLPLTLHSRIRIKS
jgi:hypothetical protein